MATSLSSHLLDLQAFLRELSPAPGWSRVLLVEDSEIIRGTRSKVARSSLREPPAFSDRFDELARRGFPWINLVGNGILGGALIVSVETPRASTGTAIEHVAVNLSGPTKATREDGRWDL